MQINLLDVLSYDGKVVEVEAGIEMEKFQSRLGSFPITDKSAVKFILTNNGDKEISVKGSAEVTVAIPCGRCLETVKEKFLLDIDRTVDMKLSEEDRINNLDENSYLEGYYLDVDMLVHSEILVNWPMKVLCNEECKGICNRCGTNLNLGPCDCDTADLDPRMAVVRDIFSKFKEV